MATFSPATFAGVAAPPARSRRRFAWALGAIATVVLGVVLVVAVGGTRPPASAPVTDDRAATPSEAPPPAPPPTPATPTPAVAAAPTPAPAPTLAAAQPAPPPEPKPSSAAGPSPPRRRAGGARVKNQPLDPYAASADPLPATPPLAAPPHSPHATASQPDPATPSPASASKPPPAADACAAGCKVLAGCHLGSSTCEAECAKHGTLGTCLAQAANDCNRFAACWFAASCRGVAPHGQHTCWGSMDCETACNGNAACICGCIGGLAPSHAAALLSYNGCGLACRDADCIARQCASQVRWCKAE